MCWGQCGCVFERWCSNLLIYVVKSFTLQTAQLHSSYPATEWRASCFSCRCFWSALFQQIRLRLHSSHPVHRTSMLCWERWPPHWPNRKWRSETLKEHTKGKILPLGITEVAVSQRVAPRMVFLTQHPKYLHLLLGHRIFVFLRWITTSWATKLKVVYNLFFRTEAESQKTEIDKLKQQLQGHHPTQANTPSNTNDSQLVNITQILMLCLEKMNFFLYSFYSDHAAKLEELETHKSEVVELKQELKGTEITWLWLSM